MRNMGCCVGELCGELSLRPFYAPGESVLIPAKGINVYALRDETSDRIFSSVRIIAVCGFDVTFN